MKKRKGRKITKKIRAKIEHLNTQANVGWLAGQATTQFISEKMSTYLVGLLHTKDAGSDKEKKKSGILRFFVMAAPKFGLSFSPSQMLIPKAP